MCRYAMALLLVNASLNVLMAQDAELSRVLPVREVSVFKDGHAYVIHRGQMPVDAEGVITLDQLPNPVLGTFWPASLDPKVRLQTVIAGRQSVAVSKSALTIRELIEANEGVDAIFTDTNKQTFQAKIHRFLSRPAKERDPSSPDADSLPQQRNIVLLKTGEGTRAIPIESISDVRLLGEYRTRFDQEEMRNRLKIKVDLQGKSGTKVDVGLAYVQKGIRWFPNYRIDLKGNGQAVVKLQATLLNELIDLKDATVNLVIGVPSFAFQDTRDPIALQQSMAQLSPYFESANRNPQLGMQGLSNVMMSQNAAQVPGGRADREPDLGPPELAGKQSEDFFVFTLNHITLAKGQRMVVPVSEATVAYQDIYTLDLPFAPPVEMRQSNPNVPAEVLKLVSAPKVQHKIRMTNSMNQPFTTAPALLFRDDRVLSQGMMTYTPRGAKADLTLTTAVNVSARKKERETKRTANATTLNGNTYSRIDIGGNIELHNRGATAIEIEITRSVLGNIDSAWEGATVEKVNVLEDEDVVSFRPPWWGYYSWPAWWSHFNGMGRITDTLKLAPGQKMERQYAWHYIWR